MTIQFAKITKLLSTTFLVLLSFAILFIPSMTAYAQTISIEPFNFDRTDPNARGWFIYNVEPGTVIEDHLVLRNDHTSSAKVELRSNDAIATSDGTFTLISNQLENKELGSWVKLDQSIYDIDAKTNLKIPFRIEVPSDAKPGEYGGGVSVILVNEEIEGSGGPISARIRVGARIYLTVKGSLEQNTQLSDLLIVNPRMDNFEEEVDTRGFISPENMVLRFKAKELGNVFSRSTGEIKIETPDGKTIDRKLNRDYYPGAETDYYYIETRIPYQLGKTKVRIDYKNDQLVKNKDAVDNKIPEGSLEFTLDFTQEDLDKFNEIIKKLKEISERDFGNSPVAAPAQQSAFSIKEPEKTETQEENSEDKDKEESNNTLLYVLLSAVVVLLIVILVVVLFRKKREDKNQSSDNLIKEDIKNENYKDTKEITNEVKTETSNNSNENQKNKKKK